MQPKCPGHQQGCSENGLDTGRKSIDVMKDGSKNIELEELKMKNMRNNILILFLGVVIGLFIVF